jgi:PAS domain S-box-containing protein
MALLWEDSFWETRNMPIDSKLLTRIKNNDPTCFSLDLSCQKLNLSDICELVAALNQNPNITSVDLSHNQINNEGAILLAKNTIITTLKLAGNQIDFEAASAFAENTQLEYLDLSENQLNDVGAITLAQNKKITTLCLNANQIGDSGAIALAQQPTLTTLMLQYNNITEVAAVALALNNNLTFLNLNYNRLGILGATAIAKSSSLISLFLAGNDINNIGLHDLACNLKLQVLDVSYNQISDEWVSALRQNHSLHELTLSHNQLTSRSAKILAGHQKLRYLDLSYNMLGDEGASIFAQKNALTELNLTGNGIGSKGAEALAKNTHLIKLIMCYNFVEDAGAIALAKNERLSLLSLSYNQITDKGAMELARSHTLKTLFLNYNYIGAEGRAALNQNQNFQLLQLSAEQPPDFTAENLSTIFLLTQDLLCILGLDDNIQFFNPTFARVLGYKDDELLGVPLYSLLHPDDCIRERNESLTAHLKFPIAQRIYRYRHKDGSYRTIQWSSQMKHDRIYASGIDLTEQQESSEKLRKTQQKGGLARLQMEQSRAYSQQLSEFIAHLCHEVRNPLTGINGSIEVMQEPVEILQTYVRDMRGKLAPSAQEKIEAALAKIKECITDIAACTGHEIDILNDNLDLAKMAENKLHLISVPFDLKNAVYEVSRMLKNRADQKGITLNLFLPQEALWVKGDPTRTKQILINLVSNAIKFTHEGHVDVALVVKEQSLTCTKVEMCVTDTGIGLSDEEASILFGRFIQANLSVGDQYGGSGLGLLLAKNLAILMDGNITIESQKGEGSTFRCTIQCSNLLEEEKAQTLKKREPVEPTRSHQGLTILIVDDNALNRKLLGSILEKAGYQCLFAVDGLDAVRQYSQHTLNLIFMDIIMPNLNGLDATKQIRQLEKEKQLPHTVIIALTGNALEVQQKEAREAGIDAYVTKPYKKEQILEKITKFFCQPTSAIQTAPRSQLVSSQTFWQSAVPPLNVVARDKDSEP